MAEFTKEELETDGVKNPYSNNYYWVYKYWRSLCPDLGVAPPLQLFQAIESIKVPKKVGIILTAGEFVLFKEDEDHVRLLLGFMYVPPHFQRKIEGLEDGVILRERWLAFTCEPTEEDCENPNYVPVIQMCGVAPQPH
jgi:hypothetical protein